MTPPDFKKIRQYALRRLAAKSDHSATLSIALKRKGAHEEQIDSLIEEFTELGYLNDSEWLSRFIEGRRDKGYGNRYIFQKLREKGLSKDQIESALEKDETDVMPGIHRLLTTRYQNKERPNVISALVRRGFTYDQIYSALSNFQNVEKKGEIW